MQWLSQNWIWIVFAAGMFLLMWRGGRGHAYSGTDQISDPDNRPKDPTSGERVNPESAVNSMYQGRLYYFASRENREKFETSPAEYASAADGHDDGHRHRRHGC